MGIVTTLLEHADLVLATLGLFSIIAKITPTDVDNKIVNSLTKVIHTLGLTKK